MKFIHLGDTHIGKVYKDETRNDDIKLAFSYFVNKAIEIKPDFIVHSGDLFNEGFPRIEDLIFVTDQLMKIKNAGIKLFAIPGSHDVGYGEENSIIDIFDKSDLLTNLNSTKYLKIEDNEIILKGEKYKNAFIAGIKGKRTRAQEDLFKKLKVEMQDAWIKIFLFHHTISELGEEFKDIDINDLPKGFDYYAAGHWHGHKDGIKYEKGIINYPGSLEYCDAFEIENYNERGFYLIDYDEEGIKNIEYINIPTKQKEIIYLNVENLKASEIFNQIILRLNKNEGKLLIIKLEGKMNGFKSELDIERIKEICKENGYSYVNINTSKLQDSKSSEKIEIKEKRIDEIEEKYLAKKGFNEKEIKIAKLLMLASEENKDSERLLDELMKEYDN
ncbi:MAG: exonuclease SbcCD subunit D [Candidatus Parvarchaeota archaeon]|nr:exonuclease SbcCD subunit D [Candidatus Rehaiarchaeum fermentans]